MAIAPTVCSPGCATRDSDQRRTVAATITIGGVTHRGMPQGTGNSGPGAGGAHIAKAKRAALPRLSPSIGRGLRKGTCAPREIRPASMSGGIFLAYERGARSRPSPAFMNV